MDGIKGRGQATALSVIGCDLKFEDFMKLGIGWYWRISLETNLSM